MNQAAAVRKSAVAGQFYPADPVKLRSEINSYLAKVDVDRTERDILAMIAPHAGYIYSGPVAAFAYSQIQGRSYDTVVVISPSHRLAFGFSSVFAGRSYESPLGSVPVNREVVEAIGSEAGESVRLSDEGHLRSGEHSLEVQLPFLQVVLESFTLVPIVMGSQNLNCCDDLVEVLSAALKGRQALIVASSDLSHYHSQQDAERLDNLVIDRINRFDPDGLIQDIAQRKAEACGAGPVYTAMKTAARLGATSGENLHYATSAETSGDYSHVVGYTAGIFYR
jgi:MEMO1 family protein